MSDRNANPGDAIAVIGMSGRFPDAPDVDALWRNLCERRESISRFSDAELLASGVAPELIRAPNYVPAAAVLSDIEQFDAEFFHLSPREAECTDPQHRVLLECAWEALECAGYVGERFDGRVAVYVGAGPSSYWLKNLANNPGVASSLFEEQSLIGNVQDYAATRISYKLNLTGPSLVVGTACSTSLVAVHLGCQSLLDFHCDIALAGGVSIRVPSRGGYLYYEGGINSPDGHCRPFDAGARGTLTGSGAGIVALRRLEDALEAGDTIWAVILGTAANNDGCDKIGFTAPSELGQSAVIAEALALAGVSPDTITLLEAHGTATPLGDPIEVAALTRVFRRSTERRRFCALGSIKGNMGHLDEAAGVAGLIKVVLALRYRTLPPSLHFHCPNPKLDLENSPFFVNTSVREWVSDGPRRAGVSSFGIGGTNVHAVLEEAPLRPPTDPITRPAALLALSARTRGALDTLCRNLAAHLQDHPEVSLADAAFTLAVGRREFPERCAVVSASSAEAVAQLRSGAPLATTAAADRPPRRAVFLFPGQGSQYSGMGAGLYRDEPAFRAAIDTCARVLEERCGLDLLAALFPSAETATSLDETSLAQPALFSIEYAIATLLRSWGIEPEAMAGHSLGEYVAATVAGVFALEDALTLVAARSRLMHSTPLGCMIAVPMSAAELAPYLVDGRISLAALNAPASTVLSGPPDAIAAVEADLAGRGSIRLRTSRAFHSPLMKPILSEFEALVRKTRLFVPRIRFVSNVTGEWITPAEAVDPTYWVRHLREPVRFVHGVRQLLTVLDTAWIEAGPGRVLAKLVGQHTDRPTDLRVLPTLPSSRSKSQESTIMLATLGELWGAGMAVDWAAFFKLERRRRVPLPTYPFERRRFWIDAPRPVPRKDPEVAPPEEMKASTSSSDSWFYAPRWRQLSKVGTGSFADEAWVILDDGGGIAPRVASLLRQAEARLVVVRDSPTWSRASDEDVAFPLTDAAMHARLWRELGAPWDGANILYFAEAQPAARAALPSEDHPPLLSLLALVQGLGAASGMRRLTVVTNGSQSVLQGLEVSSPGHATLWGAMRVIAEEYPNLQCSTIDLEAITDRSNAETAAELLTAIGQPDVAALAVRKGALWEQHLEPVLLPPASASRIRERGVYLITGGLGSMGLAFAEYLARTARARLVLISRSGLSVATEAQGPDGNVSRFPFLKRVGELDEMERTSHRAVNGAMLAAEPGLQPLLDSHSERDAQVRERIRRMEADGAEVCVLAADVSIPRELDLAIAAAETRFGRIQGVIHTAGVLGQTLVHQQSAAEVRRVLAPKVQGTLHLAAALEDRPLDFFVLCGSMSALIPISGQFDYSAANAFIDAFAHERASRRPGLTVAIDWGFWQELGMIETARISEAAKQAVRDEIAAEQWHGRGVEILARILHSGDIPAQLLISPRPPASVTAAASPGSEALPHPILSACVMRDTESAVFEGSITSGSAWFVDEHRVAETSGTARDCLPRYGRRRILALSWTRSGGIEGRLFPGADGVHETGEARGAPAIGTRRGRLALSHSGANVVRSLAGARTR